MVILTIKGKDKPNSRYISETFSEKNCFCEIIVAFWSVFWGQRRQHSCVDDQNYDQNNKIDIAVSFFQK